MEIESSKSSSGLIKKKWDKTDIPDLSGKTAIITGANSGTGYEVSKALAGKGAEVIMACRDVEKGELAEAKIKEEFPKSSLKFMVLDLADLSSVKNFANMFHEKNNSLDILCNNAGVMATPQVKTKDGFELQFGTNHLGHFALTGLLLDKLLGTSKSRIVNVSSIAHMGGIIDFDDLMNEKKYSRFPTYSQSKLANLLFTYELQRRLETNGCNTISVGSHPGLSRTNLGASGFGYGKGKILKSIIGFFAKLTCQSAAMGALPILYASTSLDVNGGEYIGPRGFREFWGYPKKVESSKDSHDEEIAEKLWSISTDLTQVHYHF